MKPQVDVVKEPAGKGVVHNVVDKKTRKVIGKYILGPSIKVDEVIEEEKKVLTLTVNGFDN